MNEKAKGYLRGLLGGAIGGVAGWFAFFWALRQGFYALAIVGLFLGLGCRLAKGRGKGLPAFCAVAALILGMLAEWQAPFIRPDDSLVYFLKHLHEESGMTWVMLILGAAVAYWEAYLGNAAGIVIGGGKPAPVARTDRKEEADAP